MCVQNVALGAQSRFKTHHFIRDLGGFKKLFTLGRTLMEAHCEELRTRSVGVVKILQRMEEIFLDLD